MKKFLKNEKGFTLVEMIVVIVLVGLLAAIAIPLYSDYTKKAKESEGKHLLGALMPAANAWYQEKGTFVGFDTGTKEFDTIIKDAEYYAYDAVSQSTTFITLQANSAVYSAYDADGTVDVTNGGIAWDGPKVQ